MRSADPGAVAEEQRLSDWIQSRGVARSNAYALVRLLGIEPEQRRVPGARSAASYISADDVARLDAMADRLAEGISIRQLERELSGTVPHATGTLARTVPDGDRLVSGTVPDASGTVPHTCETVRARAEAALAAARAGLPLTSTEVRHLLGVRPTGQRVQRGRLVAIRTGPLCWVLEQAEG